MQKIIKEKEQNEYNDEIKKFKEKEKLYNEEVIDITKEFFTSEYYDRAKVDSGQDEKIETGKMTIVFTTSQNQKNNLDINATSIDLGECEALIKNDNNISINETLYIIKIDVFQEGMKTKKVGYDVYYKLFGKGLVKLKLSSCKDTKITILIPYEISEPVDKLNISSGYYNDICYTTTTKDGTDITLNDRKKIYAIGNMIVCQEECDFADYNYTTFKAKCLCKAKESSSSLTNFNIDIAQLLKNIKHIKNFANFNILKCYKKLFNLKGIKENVGSYLLISIIFFHLFNIIIFYMKQFLLIKNKIKDIVFGINNQDLLEQNKKLKKKGAITNKKNTNKKKNLITNNAKKDIKVSTKRIVKKKEKIRNLKGAKISININTNIINNNLISGDKNATTKIITSYDNIKKIESNNEQNKIDKIKNIMKYIDDEINLLSYELAIQYDKRSYCEYYITLIKTKHCLIFALFNNNDYNSNIIKIDLFLIGFAIYYTVNALFYDDDTMHKIYERKGKFDLESQIPIIAYSSLISIILNIILKILALSNDAIISFKQNKKKIGISKREQDLYNKLSIKFFLFFFISFLFLGFFWYYISMFGAIYKNTQLHLLKDTLITFGLSLVYPFATYLLPGIFRIPSLSNEKNKRECLYNFSKIVQLI